LRITWGGVSFWPMPDIGRVMGGEVERRAARRFAMSLPMKVRFVSDDGAVEESGETCDISFRGLYFMIGAMIEKGASIEFILTLPQQITLAGDVHIRCYARVLRVESRGERRGIAARIERYEFLPTPA
jgi:PilZ domain